MKKSLLIAGLTIVLLTGCISTKCPLDCDSALAGVTSASFVNYQA